jgi:hypothetical protein
LVEKNEKFLTFSDLARKLMPERRDVMVKTNPDGKYNEVDVVKERVVEKQLVATGGNFARKIPATRRA